MTVYFGEFRVLCAPKTAQIFFPRAFGARVTVILLKLYTGTKCIVREAVRFTQFQITQLFFRYKYSQRGSLMAILKTCFLDDSVSGGA